MTSIPHVGRNIAAAVFTVAALLFLAWMMGWQSRLGRLDPALVVPWLMPVLLWRIWRLRRAPRRQMIWHLGLIIILLLTAQAALALVWADASLSALAAQILAVALGYGVAALLGYAALRLTSGHGLLCWLVSMGMTLLWLLASHMVLSWAYHPSPARADAPPAVMMTGLPLRWSGSADLTTIFSGQSYDDIFLSQLESLGPVSLVDSFNGVPPPRDNIVFLVHPRAMAPQDLAAVDAHVRGGGRALILADALSSWPAAHPLGDPRNAPITSLLTPLLDHWAIQLDAVPHGQGGEAWAGFAGHGLRLYSAGRFSAWPPGCVAVAGRTVLHCKIGRGSLWLVGDADFLHAPLWQADGWDAGHLMTSDALYWIADQLWGDRAGRALLRPLWMRRPPNF